MSSDIPASPYADLPAAAFWRSAVVEGDATAAAALHRPRFALTSDTPILTAGSCFAQHIHRHLTALGWAVVNAEPGPDMLPPRVAQRYGYGVYSARYGNVYTVRQWVELIEEAMAPTSPAPIIWQHAGRYYDALRPGVEPEGLDSAAEVAQSRAAHLSALRTALAEAACVVFTLGLTESWVDTATGRTLPTAPGTLAGDMARNPAHFVNLGYEDVLADLNRMRQLVRAINPDMTLLLTVSPVPLTATATGGHVVQASTLSKAILRAACDAMQRAHADVDYFPSYEIITTPALGGPFFARNLRSPSDAGVARVMQAFLHSYGAGQAVAPVPRDTDTGSDWDAVCEEMLLDAFAR
ncbi:MAG: GSCFA domain-containing protein [Pseudomonadota bacterium]